MHKIFVILIFLSMMFFQGLVIGANSNSTGLKVELAKGKIDGYWVHLPIGHNNQKSWPILVFFHGSGQLDSGLDSVQFAGPIKYAKQDKSKSGKLRNIIRSNFIIISPHLRGIGEEYPLFYRSWAKQVKTIDAIIETVLNRYSGNKEKIYLTGLSLGGGASWLLPNLTKHAIAAIIPVCGSPMGYFRNDPRKKDKTSTEPNEKFSPFPFKKIPVWNTCNSGDSWPKRVFQITAIRDIERLGGEKFLRLSIANPSGLQYLKHRRIFTSFKKKGHNAWSSTYNSIQIYKWLLSFSNRNGRILKDKNYYNR